MSILRALIILVLAGFPGTVQAGYMNCQSTDSNFEQTFAIGFADTSPSVILLQHTWFRNGVRVGGVVYADRTYKNFDLPDWQLGVYAGKSKRRNMTLSILARKEGNNFLGTVVDFDRVADTLESFNVNCTFRN